MTLQCRLSDYDRRTPVDDFKPLELTDAQVNIYMQREPNRKQDYLVSTYDMRILVDDFKPLELIDGQVISMW